MSIDVPEMGYIFWPVGTGDSTTICISDTVYLQVDLRHMEKSEDSDDPAWPVIDELINFLPTLNNKPYLSTFALTHPDKDHCQGFGELNRRVIIGELWMSPRTFREHKSDEGLSEDASAFHKEAMRRVKATIASGGAPGRGDRIRIIGYDRLLKSAEFTGFPDEFLTVPGNAITRVDGEDYSGQFRAFIHAPFLDDSYGDRNDCSLAFQITLTNGAGFGQALMMGDLTYTTVNRIFQFSNPNNLSWNVLLAPHHCSKSVMYWKDEGTENETPRRHIVDAIGKASLSPGYIIASSAPIPVTNELGDNPPHTKAKVQYLTIAKNAFICTHEHPNKANPVPVVFEISQTGLQYVGATLLSAPLSEATKRASSGAETPKSATGFGESVK